MSLKEYMETDIIQALMPALNRGWYIDAKTHKICVDHDKLSTDTPWVHIANYTNRKCHIDLVVFQTLGFIHTRCRNCWKVCARPKNFRDAMAALEVMREMGHQSKIGFEPRTWVKHPWGAYFYCDSKEEGLDRKDEVKEAFKHIDPDMTVILKRYCTELEIKTCPSDEYVPPEQAEKWEKLIAEHVDEDYVWTGQPEYLQRHVIVAWTDFAWSIGDMTVKEFNNGENLYSSLVEYEREELDA